MSSATMRRPGQGQPGAPSETADPAHRLAPRRTTHLRDAVVLGMVGVGGCGVAGVTGHPAWDVPILAAGLGVGTAHAVSGELRRQRRHLHDQLVEALAPLLGTPLDRRVVRLSQWTRGWPGLPREVLLHYNSGVRDTDVWRDQVLATVRGRVMGRYELVGWHRRRCVVRLRLVEDERDSDRWSHLRRRPGLIDDHVPPSQQRITKAITELIGATARTIDVSFDADEALQSITMAHEAGAKLAAAGYRARVEKVVTTMMPGRWRAQWDLENDTVRFEIRPQLPDSLWVPTDQPVNVEDLLANYRGVQIPLAVDEDGVELVWRPAVSPHLLLTGGTGSGKTSVARAVIAKITQYGWPVWILDAKRIEFLDMRDWPNVQIVAGSLPQQVALIRRVWELMEYRYELIEKGVCRPSDFEPLVVFADEFADFRINLLEWYAQIKVKGDPARPPTSAEFGSLLRKARTCRIHIITALQRPDVELLGTGEQRDNFGARVSLGRLMSAQAAIMVWGDPTVGVAIPRGKVGRGTATRADGTPVEAQTYRFPDPDADLDSDEGRLIAALRPAQARHPRLVIVPPEESLEPDAPPTFRDYARAEWALAEQRPDLDPLAQPAPSRDEGRRLASTLSALGIDDGQTPPTEDGEDPGLVGRPSRRPQLRLLSVADRDVVDADDQDQEPAVPEADDDYAGYASPVSSFARDLVVGDLIEVDPESGVWVVVDEPPEDDVVSPGLVAVSWRGDGDESGSISISDSQQISVRRPDDQMEM